MGKLASTAILGGRKCRLPEEDNRDFFLDVLAATNPAGFSIAGRILEGEKLDREDIEYLLQTDSYPLLLKLVELRIDQEPVQDPRPLKIIEIGNWIKESGYEEALEKTKKALCSYHQQEVDVVFDGIDLLEFSDPIVQFLTSLKRTHPDLRFVGPSVEEIELSIGRLEELRDFPDQRIGQILSRLKSLGFARLRICCERKYLPIVSEFGFPVSLHTNLDQYTDASALAGEFLSIQRDVDQVGGIQIWMPGVSRWSEWKMFPPGALDWLILRALAVGTIVLDQIQFRRASTACLTCEGLEFSRLCGANDFGFGSLDNHTARKSRLSSYHQVVEAVRRSYSRVRSGKGE